MLKKNHTARRIPSNLFIVFAGKKNDEDDSNDVASLLREALQQQDE